MKFVESVSKEILLFVILAVLVVLPIRLFIAQPFVVEGESMYPTFENGDYLIIDEITYRLDNPERFDVVVFRYPLDERVFFIKRIVGLPGEIVSIQQGVVTVTKLDGTSITLEEPYVVADDATYTLTTTLGEDRYFVMGDNRPKSSDSRVWGTLPRENMMGRAIVRLLPFEEAGFFPGAFAAAP